VRVALDTNLLVYAEGVNDAARRDAVLALLGQLPSGSVVLPVQVLGELFVVLTRKAGRSREQARAALLSWRDAYPLTDTSQDVMLAAADLAADHQLGLWDAVILAAAAKAGCRLLLSEDLTEGFTWGGVTVTNPLAAQRHALLAALIEHGG
jgi:predicted nucleic acid-binding protein